LGQPRVAREERNSLPQLDPNVVGKIGVDLHQDLSANARKLLDCLIEERGDADLLPIYAAEDKFDLDAALDELRQLALLDESDPKRVKLVSRRLE